MGLTATIPPSSGPRSTGCCPDSLATTDPNGHECEWIASEPDFEGVSDVECGARGPVDGVMDEPGTSRRPPSARVDHFRAIVGHHVWATQQLIDRCLQLSPAELELTTAGTYGSIHATLAHLVHGDGGLQSAASGEEFGYVPPGSPPSVATLRADMERQAARWRELVADDGIEHAEVVFLTQALHHAAEHRTHVCSILGAHGLEVPDLSAW